jgi:hypothetical protein
MASEYRYREESGFFEINAEQHTHFEPRPLFHALCIVINEPVKNATEQIVYLVSTSIVTSGLSEPISHKGIGDEGTRGEISGGNVVTTTLPVVIEFVMELDKNPETAEAQKEITKQRVTKSGVRGYRGKAKNCEQSRSWQWWRRGRKWKS